VMHAGVRARPLQSADGALARPVVPIEPAPEDVLLRPGRRRPFRTALSKEATAQRHR
jgi:hypothetical protein